MIPLHPVAAVAIVLAVAAAGSGDYELIVPGWPDALSPICAKSETVCDAARLAIFEGRLDDIAPQGTRTRCVAHPQCFPAESNFIPGYSAPGTR